MSLSSYELRHFWLVHRRKFWCCSVFGFQGTISAVSGYKTFSASWTGFIFVSVFFESVGSSGLEPPTSRLSGVRSNRLSYEPSDQSVFSFFNSGGHLFSHIVSNIVPSAAWVLTVVFGMRTGVTPKRIATGNISVLYDHFASLPWS